ncbi:MAG: hypothetical protein AAGN35_24890 [Bacteroidota bacterium]
MQRRNNCNLSDGGDYGFRDLEAGFESQDLSPASAFWPFGKANGSM